MSIIQHLSITAINSLRIIKNVYRFVLDPLATGSGSVLLYDGYLRLEESVASCLDLRHDVID